MRFKIKLIRNNNPICVEWKGVDIKHIYNPDTFTLDSITKAIEEFQKGKTSHGYKYKIITGKNV